MNELEILFFRLHQWVRYLRLQKAIYWGARGLIIGILSSGVVAIFLIPNSSLLLSEYFTWLFVSGILGLISAAGIAFFWPRPQLKLARSYDRIFNLKERVSTAVELSQSEAVNQSWQELQLGDALEATGTISPKDGIKWHFPKSEIWGVLVALTIVLGTWFYGQASFQQAESRAKNQKLIEAEVDNLEELITDIESREQLSVDAKESISTPLKKSLDDMKNADSLEKAVSILSETQQTIEELNFSGSTEFEGLQGAGEQLAKKENSQLNLTGDALRQGDLQRAAENLAALDLSKINPQALAGLAEQLKEMAEQLGNSSPEFAEQLQKVSEAIQNDDIQSAQEAISNASEALSESAQRVAASDTAQKTTDTLAESQGRLMAASMFEGMAQNSGAKNDSGDHPEGEQKGSFGSQAGSGEFEASKTPGKEAGLTPLTQNNQAGGENSEKQYDSVYAPQRLGGSSETELSLGSGSDSASNAIGSVGNSSEQNAQSFVPYSEIFSNYDESIQQAFENGVVPLALQPLIRDYFSSLDPR